MDSWRTRIQQGPIRSLIVVCLLAGVFAMHGLTGNHDAAMAMAHQVPATTSADHPAPVTTPLPRFAHGEMSALHAMRVTAADAGATFPDAKPQLTLTAQTGNDGHLHAMGDVCLAMLVALLLALVAALALRSLTGAHPVPQLSFTLRVPLAGPAPPWLQPSLSKLCVLRT